MTHFDEIYEIAADNYGLVTYTQAQEAGIVGAELNRYVADGRLDRRGHGVYKLTRHVPTGYDRFAEAVALAGEGAYLYGDAVLAMHGLALANPRAVTVALPRRTRKKVPDWVRIVAPKGGDAPVRYEGIPSQSVANALRACAGSVMRGRLLDAIGDARARGLITAAEQRRLRKEIA